MTLTVIVFGISWHYRALSRECGSVISNIVFYIMKDSCVGIMIKQVEIETKRLFLRRWQDADLNAFISMNADTTVMRFFPATLNAEET